MHVSRRVIARADSISTGQMEAWDKVCGTDSIALIPEAECGTFQFLVNEHRYAIFARTRANQLRGIIGSDTENIDTFRQLFDCEFVTTLIRSEQRWVGRHRLGGESAT